MKNELRLSELEDGQEGIVSAVKGDRRIRRRILDMGIVKGTKIQIVRRAPLGDPIEFTLRGYHLSLRKEDADRVYVRFIQKTSKE